MYCSYFRIKNWRLHQNSLYQFTSSLKNNNSILETLVCFIYVGAVFFSESINGNANICFVTCISDPFLNVSWKNSLRYQGRFKYFEI